MSAPYPEQSASYKGPITNTARWEKFQHRADDIFVCTPPKCGTTWTQAICAMLVFGKVDHGVQPGVISPWIDAEFAPIDEYLQQVEAQSHRRFIKTHTPLDGIPYNAECSYFVIFRDPRDVFFSGLNHRDNMSDQELANNVFSVSKFGEWINTKCASDQWDQPSLEALTHIFNSYWPYRNLPNIHTFHYSDMKRDLEGTIGQMSSALGYNYSAAEIKTFAAAADFESMKNKAEQYAPESGTGMWKAESNFFANGSSRQWEGKLTPSELAEFEVRVRELVPADAIDWFLDGAGT